MFVVVFFAVVMCLTYFLFSSPLNLFSAHPHNFPVLLLLFSESEPSVERTGVMSSSVRSDLRASAVLCADPDPHLLGFPDHYIPLGPTAALVRGLDTTYRVSTCDHAGIKTNITSLHN